MRILRLVRYREAGHAVGQTAAADTGAVRVEVGVPVVVVIAEQAAIVVVFLP